MRPRLMVRTREGYRGESLHLRTHTYPPESCKEVYLMQEKVPVVLLNTFGSYFCFSSRACVGSQWSQSGYQPTVASVSVRKFFSKGSEIMKGVFPSLGIFKQPIFVLPCLLFFFFYLWCISHSTNLLSVLTWSYEFCPCLTSYVLLIIYSKPLLWFSL